MRVTLTTQANAFHHKKMLDIWSATKAVFVGPQQILPDCLARPTTFAIFGILKHLPSLVSGADHNP